MARLERHDEEAPRTRRRRVKDPLLTETILGVLAVIFVMIAVLLLFSMVHAGGEGGELLFTGIYSIIGVFSYFVPLLCLYVAYYLWKEEVPAVRFLPTLGIIFLILGIAGLGTIFSPTFGGIMGALIAGPLIKNFAIYPTAALLAGVTAIGGIIVLERKPSLSPLLALLRYPLDQAQALITARKERTFDDEPEAVEPEPAEEPAMEEQEEEEETIPMDNLRTQLFGELSPEEEEPKKEVKEVKAKPIILTPEFVPPPLELLNPDSGKSGAGDSKSKMLTIQKTLEH